jgi:hypothetical protein
LFDYFCAVRSFYVCLAAGLLMLSSCGGSEEAPFTTGSRFSYATTYTSAGGRVTKFDTLSFTIEPADITSFSLDLKKIRWQNTQKDYYQLRGLNVRDGIVELQLPTNYKGFSNELIAVPGHPTVSATGAQGTTLEDEDNYLKGYGVLSGLTIKQRAQYLRDTSISFDGQPLPCRLYERYNVSHRGRFGRYRMRYAYNPIYGFVTIECLYPQGKHISMRLTDVAIKR